MKARWLVLLLASCRVDETTGPDEDLTGLDEAPTEVEQEPIGGADQALGPIESDAPPQVELEVSPPDPVRCEGWLGLGGEEDCIYVWSNCSDGNDREVRCSRSGERYACACIKGGASISGFESDELCLLTAGPMSLERALLSEAVSPGCGWEIVP